MMARAYGKPVLVCCETYKFGEHVQTDSITSNELGDPRELATTLTGPSHPLANWEDSRNLKLLSLRYDLTPIGFVEMVITEVGMIPPTSVPVIIRERKEPTGT